MRSSGCNKAIIYDRFRFLHPKQNERAIRKMKALMSKRKPEQSFCYAPTEERGCIFPIRFPDGHLSQRWQRKRTARIIHNPGCICRFALGFCRNKKKRTETLYQSFSPFMWNDSKNDTILGYRFAIQLSFCIGCKWVQPGAKLVRWVHRRASVLLNLAINACNSHFLSKESKE